MGNFLNESNHGFLSFVLEGSPNLFFMINKYLPNIEKCVGKVQIVKVGIGRYVHQPKYYKSSLLSSSKQRQKQDWSKATLLTHFK
jgi:hypothetical protein